MVEWEIHTFQGESFYQPLNKVTYVPLESNFFPLICTYIQKWRKVPINLCNSACMLNVIYLDLLSFDNLRLNQRHFRFWLLPSITFKFWKLNQIFGKVRQLWFLVVLLWTKSNMTRHRGRDFVQDLGLWGTIAL